MPKPLSAAPPNALRVWSDGLSLFTELPGPDGHMHVIRYPLTNAGLSQCLGIIRTRAFDAKDRTGPRPDQLERRQAARELLRKLGIHG